MADAKQIRFRLSIGAATFFIGVGLMMNWLNHRPAGIANLSPDPGDCYPVDADGFDFSHYLGAAARPGRLGDVKDYPGTAARPAYSVDVKKNGKTVSSEEANARETARIFGLFREAPLTSDSPSTAGGKPLTSSSACVDESYRLTWIPTFHRPTVIRIWRSKDRYFIVIKRLSGRGGYDLGTLETERAHSLTAEEWQSFKSLNSDDAFWNSPSTIDEPLINDGAAWMLEAFRDGRYHLVRRLIPSKEFARILVKMFELSGVETEYRRYL